MPADASQKPPSVGGKLRLYEPPVLRPELGDRLAAVDPAVRVLHWAEYVWSGSAWRLVDLGATSGEVPGTPRYLVFEVPQDYADFRVARADLDRIRRHVVRAARPHLDRGATVYEVLPRDWKRGIPKEVHHARALERLAPAEAGLLPGPGARGYDHNAWDALTLGLWATGRLTRRRV